MLACRLSKGSRSVRLTCQPALLALISGLAFAGAAGAQGQPAAGAAPLAGGTALSATTPVTATTGGFVPGLDQSFTPLDTAGMSDSGWPMPAFLAANGAFDAKEPDLVATISGGVEVSPAYFGSNHYEVGPHAAVRLDYVRFPNGFEFGSGRAVGYRTGLGLRTSVRYIPTRNTANSPELTGLDNVPWAFEAGLGLGYEERNYRVFADVRYGIIGTNAWTGDVGADAIAYPIQGLTLTLGPRLNFASERFTNTYFGVTPDQAAGSNGNLAAYSAQGGLVGGGVVLGARYLLNERWGVEGAASWDRLLNGAADLPITENGSADQYSVGINLTRRISLDF